MQYKNDKFYIFHHIPKCGGTSIKSLLANWFITVDDYRDGWTLNYPKKIDIKKLTPAHCLCGHFELDGYYLYQRYPQALSDNRIKLFTFVRDPLEIQLSLFRYEMAHGVNKSDNIVDHLNLRKNYLANRFPVTETNYKEIIDKYFFVGILEYIKPSIEILSTILRKNNTNIPWLNKTNIKNTNYLLSDKLIEEFKSNNVLDYKVYHYCLEKFKASLSENKKIILQKNKQTHNLSNRAKDFITTQNKSQIAPEILIASENPRISIITPSFNQAEFLEESINSVLNQGYPNLEYIIMDGGSTDGSVDIIKKYKKYLKHWQSKKDNGQYWAINQGFKNTSGEIMSWLNSDDKYYPKSFFLVAEIFKSDKKYQWITGIPNHIDRNSNMSWIIKKIPKYSRFKYLCGEYDSPFIQQEGTFWKRSLWEKAGNYLETNYRLASDLELWVRFFRHDVIYVVSQITGSYRKHGNQKAQLYMDQYIKEAEKIIKEEVIKYNTGLYSYMPLPPDPIVV